ncbi:hypothetical protein OG921_10830 [Aldersonia sp. NBC_00410]|uniref:hypothetical protein n=1 Tax=Aldersonia sp. NBC_00410 TaxID=2975954 RepID=UPI0022511E8D|nr:hypothetical protein [Aldersonia sp. NBC_00410]MCX5043658.1 hypothetical protein [Aldersonia sp. NBC_00410]
MKSMLVKTAATGGIALAALGVGAGVASAEPTHNQDPQPTWQQDQQRDTNNWDNNRDNNNRDNNNWDSNRNNHDQHPQFGAAPHGFWFFGQWIPLPW